MYEAFELCRLVEKLPLRIYAIATGGEHRERLVRINWNVPAPCVLTPAYRKSIQNLLRARAAFANVIKQDSI